MNASETTEYSRHLLKGLLKQLDNHESIMYGDTDSVTVLNSQNGTIRTITLPK